MVQASLHALPIATFNASSCSTALSCSSPCSSAWEHCHTGTQANAIMKHTFLSTVSAALAWQSHLLLATWPSTRAPSCALVREHNGWTEQETCPSSQQRNIAAMWNAFTRRPLYINVELSNVYTHRKPHTSVPAFPSGQIATKHNKTQNEQQQKKKVLLEAAATVTKKKKKKKTGYQMSRPG